jgi:hypothetical protein
MAKAPEKNSMHDALGAAMKRREAKIALAAEADAKVKAKAKAASKAKPAPQDHRPPTIGAKQVMAGFESAMEIVRARRLQALARRYPEIAKLLEAPSKIPSPIPPVENPDELPAG